MIVTAEDGAIGANGSPLAKGEGAPHSALARSGGEGVGETLDAVGVASCRVGVALSRSIQSDRRGRAVRRDTADVVSGRVVCGGTVADGPRRLQFRWRPCCDEDSGGKVDRSPARHSSAFSLLLTPPHSITSDHIACRHHLPYAKAVVRGSSVVIFMSGPIEVGTVMMPLYAIASWYGLYAYGDTGRYILPVAFVGWLWAVINIARTRRLDLGIFTFLFVVVAAMYERRYGLGRGTKMALTTSSILVAANYSLVIVFWGDISKTLARAKSQSWMNVFWTYCATMTAFWACAAARNHLRGESGGYSTVSV
ncbi:hypothetical protein ACHAXA_009248 [Cyclostephanos tholiformis]|uniref:Uncharacterized protein n=1 Tax=Cyclostephanos tholiformis TaxID=382380 RepID=A0ABD3RD91_9STRA